MNKKKNLAICLASISAVSAMLPMMAQAQKVTVTHSPSYVKEVRSDINDAMDRIEDVLDASYENAETELKSRIKLNGWDYEYTMQDFYDQGNPYAQVDYTSIIAAYGTVLESGVTSGSMNFSSIPFLALKTYSENVPGETNKYYGKSVLTAVDADDILEYFGIEQNDDMEAKYEERINLINEVLDGSNLGQTVFVKTIASVQSADTDESIYSEYIPSDLDERRSKIIKTALSLVGQVPYEWGGKPTGPGYDTSWWTYDEETGLQRGLDCSGFVQWVFETCGYQSDVTNLLSFTGTIASSLPTISYDELQPGDIGLQNETQSSMNHVGIYLGNGKWIHCASGAGTVVVNDGCFSYFRRSPVSASIDETGLRVYNFTKYTIKDFFDEPETAEEKDVYLLAQLMQHEADGEGLNGWAAVGEVVMNRINSSDFPNTLEEVVLQEDQFENFENALAEGIEPRDEILSCAYGVYTGKIRIFDNEEVLFFRNPMTTNGISAKADVDWGNYRWYCSVGHHAFYTKSTAENSNQ